MAKSTQPPNFAEKIQQLEGLVDSLEASDTSLEQSLKDFEHGIQLIRSIQKELNEAEQKVQQLVEDPASPQNGD